MPVKIDEISSEVTATGGGAPAASGGSGGGGATTAQREWEQWDRLRQAMLRLNLDQARTRSEGFDD